MTQPPRPPLGVPTMLSLALLALLAALLLLPLLGGPLPSPYLVGGVLLARLGLRVWQARADERLKRPVSWAFDLILIGLMFYIVSTPPTSP